MKLPTGNSPGDDAPPFFFEVEMFRTTLKILCLLFSIFITVRTDRLLQFWLPYLLEMWGAIVPGNYFFIELLFLVPCNLIHSSAFTIFTGLIVFFLILGEVLTRVKHDEPLQLTSYFAVAFLCMVVHVTAIAVCLHCYMRPFCRASVLAGIF